MKRSRACKMGVTKDNRAEGEAMALQSLILSAFDGRMALFGAESRIRLDSSHYQGIVSIS